LAEAGRYDPLSLLRLVDEDSELFDALWVRHFPETPAKRGRRGRTFEQDREASRASRLANLHARLRRH